jgi:HD-GYP domain-containing protein (c-di-GMP phosphodiesterase class II)
MLCAASLQPRPGLGYRDLQLLHVFARIVADVFERELLSERALRLEAEAAATRALVAALEIRDSYTAEHSRAVVGSALAVADRIGVTERERAEIEQVAMLHDIGKLGIPDQILRKPGRLTVEEHEIMRRHPEIGEQLILSSPQLAYLAPAVRAEHERWDGHGYPDGLAGEQIPLASRITFVCDSYHAMISDRPYRRGMRARSAQAELAA